MGTTEEDPEKQILERIERVQKSFIDKLISAAEDYSVDELKSMTNDGEDSETDKTYHEIGKILYGEEVPEDSDLYEITSDMKRDCITLRLNDGKNTMDAHDYLFHEYSDNKLELTWLQGISEKLNIIRDKLLELCW